MISNKMYTEKSDTKTVINTHNASMGRGFYTIMLAQFCSSLADNALFVVVVKLLGDSPDSDWKKAALVPMFAFC